VNVVCQQTMPGPKLKVMLETALQNAKKLWQR